MVHTITLLFLAGLSAAEPRSGNRDRARDEARFWGAQSGWRTVAGGALAGGGGVVRAVNTELGVVALAAGARDGVRPGMTLMVTRDGRPVARVRVTEARRAVSAATIEERADRKATPRAGDRVVVLKDGE